MCPPSLLLPQLLPLPLLAGTVWCKCLYACVQGHGQYDAHTSDIHACICAYLHSLGLFLSVPSLPLLVSFSPTSSSKSALTEEQKARIECNRQEALAKRARCVSVSEGEVLVCVCQERERAREIKREREREGKIARVRKREREKEEKMTTRDREI